MTKILGYDEAINGLDAPIIYEVVLAQGKPTSDVSAYYQKAADLLHARFCAYGVRILANIAPGTLRMVFEGKDQFPWLEDITAILGKDARDVRIQSMPATGSYPHHQHYDGGHA